MDIKDYKIINIFLVLENSFSTKKKKKKKKYDIAKTNLNPTASL